jgi:hypothetical protein
MDTGERMVNLSPRFWKVIFSVALLLILILAGGSPAQAFYCGTRLVNVGDTRFEVMRKCGAPDWVESWEEARYQTQYRKSFPDGGKSPPSYVPFPIIIYVTIEQWTYNFGPTQFIRLLTFENSRLVDIATGDYGSR